MLALSAGVYSTYYVVRDEQISEEDVVDVVEEIDSLKTLENPEGSPILTSSASVGSSEENAVSAESKGETTSLVTNLSVEIEESAEDHETMLNDQAGSTLSETTEIKDGISGIESELLVDLQEPSSDLEPRSDTVEIVGAESLCLLPKATDKKEEEKCEDTSYSPDAKLPSEKIESNGPNAVPEPINKIEKSISSQSSHSVNAVVISGQDSQNTDLRVEPDQDIKIEVGSNASVSSLSRENVIVVDDEEFDIDEVLKAIDIGNGLSWGSSTAVPRQELIHENGIVDEGGPKPELPTKSDEQETGWWSSWISTLNPFGG